MLHNDQRTTHPAPCLLLRRLGAALAPLAVALAAAACGDTEEPSDAIPMLAEAERGTRGADVQVATDAEDRVTYITAGVDGTMPPTDLGDSRVVSAPLQFRKAGEYQMYARLRIGPERGNDDSFYVNVGSKEAPNWALVNGVKGFPVAGQPGYQEAAIIDDLRGSAEPGRWLWALLDPVRLTVAEGQLAQTFSIATRENGLDIDKFAFALVGDGFTTGFTSAQLDAGRAGVKVVPPVLPPAYEPPANQPPLAVGASKWLGMVCCGNQRAFLENYFNQITPENGGKWGSVESVRDEYNWAAVDEALALAKANGFPFRYHVLLWGSQQPDWIETLPPEEQLAEIRKWFTAVSERYGDQLDYVEVVNEFQNQPPSAANEGKYVDALGGAGESGFDWVLNAFRMAREIFPASVKLMLNEYSVINNDMLTDTYVQLVQRLQQEGLIDVLGEQGHAFSTRGDVEPMLERINRLGATGLPVLITEMDVDGPADRQLVDFQRLFRGFWENPNIAGITLWGYREGMWRAAQEATLVYSNGAEKPAMRWLKGYLRGSAPAVVGPASATMVKGARSGAEVAVFNTTAPGGAAYPAQAAVSWGVATGDGSQPDASQSVAFDAGTARLRLQGALAPGVYSVRVYADVDATVSDLHAIEITVQ